MSILKTVNHLYSNFFMEFLKYPSLVLYSSSYTIYTTLLSTVISNSSPISCLLILLKLSFSSLVYHSNSQNSIILLFIFLTMSYSHLLILLVILVSSFIKICHLHNISLLFLNHVSSTFVT